MPLEMKDAVHGLLDAPHMAVLATLNPHWAPQSSVVWVSRGGGEFLISTTQGRRKALNMLRDPFVGLTVFDPACPDLYVEIRGTATVIGDTGRAVAVRVAEAYIGPGGGKGVRGGSGGGGPRGRPHHADRDPRQRHQGGLRPRPGTGEVRVPVGGAGGGITVACDLLASDRIEET
nr:TIGR03618 family F420-dependent PPOX class oxidoreductase [Streptomyces lateritius]